MLNIAHRGASVQAPENTLPAFSRALELGVDMIELDVHMSRDGELVVIHDATLGRTTDGRGRVGKKSLRELKALDAGSWFSSSFAGTRIPTLEEAIELVKGKAQLNIEVKAGPDTYPGLEERLVELLKRHSFVDQALVTSFDRQALLRVKELELRTRIGVLLARRVRDLVTVAQGARANAVCLEHSLLTKADVESCHKERLGLYLWTVNDIHEMRRLIDLGVEGIVTDRPDLLQGLLASHLVRP